MNSNISVRVMFPNESYWTTINNFNFDIFTFKDPMDILNNGENLWGKYGGTFININKSDYIRGLREKRFKKILNK